MEGLGERARLTAHSHVPLGTCPLPICVWSCQVHAHLRHIFLGSGVVLCVFSNWKISSENLCVQRLLGLLGSFPASLYYCLHETKSREQLRC